MKIRFKKLHQGRVIRIEGGGEIKEVLIHSDMYDRERGKISICFRGNRNSGIVELSSKEANDLYKTLSSKIDLIKEIKIIK